MQLGADGDLRLASVRRTTAWTNPLAKNAGSLGAGPKPIAPSVYEYDDVEMSVSSTLPTSIEQLELDAVHPEFAGFAELPAGEDDTFENHDIEQQRKQSEEQSEHDSRYGVVLSGTLRTEPNCNDDGNPEANVVANFS